MVQLPLVHIWFTSGGTKGIQTNASNVLPTSVGTSKPLNNGVNDDKFGCSDISKGVTGHSKLLKSCSRGLQKVPLYTRELPSLRNEPVQYTERSRTTENRISASGRWSFPRKSGHEFRVSCGRHDDVDEQLLRISLVGLSAFNTGLLVQPPTYTHRVLSKIQFQGV